MKILFDNQIFQVQEVGGISRYFVEIMKYFNEFNKCQYDLPINTSNNSHLLNSNIGNIKPVNISKDRFLFGSKFKGKASIYNYFINYKNNYLQKKLLTSKNYDLFHPTYYDPYFLKYINNKPFVLTIYDMIHEKFPNYFAPGNKTPKIKKLLAEKALKIIAISENTKLDIIKHYNIPEKKIAVIHFGHTKFPASGTEITPELPKKFILFVGTRKIYKNFDFFVRAIAPLLNKDKDLYLICAGTEFDKNEKNNFNILNISDQLRSYLVDGEDLSNLYKNALCFVFPSLYEGFGLPTLEAFACGCPAIISDNSCMREIGGGAAVYINPESHEDIMDKVENIIYNSNLRNEMAMNGFKKIQEFSWMKCAEKTLSVYESIV
jgi:glycosyltransferase involved in cell wall biosynthesis